MTENVKLNPLDKVNVFELAVRTPIDVKPVGYKWVSLDKKRNVKNEILRSKARLET